MPFPSRFRTKLNTSFIGYHNSGSLAASLTTFCSWNSLAAPFSAGGWTNPAVTLATLIPVMSTYFLSTNFFISYRVLRARLSIRYSLQNVADTLLMTITASTSATTPASTSLAIDQPYTTKLMMGHGYRNTIRTPWISVERFLGCPKKAIEYDLSYKYCGTVSLPPADQLYFTCNVESPDGTALVTSVPYEVDLEQEVEFFNDTSAAI